MLRVFFSLLIFSLILGAFSCSRQTDTGSTNSNNVTSAATPLPTFTDADQAFSEGARLLDENKTEQAIDALTQAATLNPDFAEAYFKLGIAYALLESQRKLNAEADETTETDPNGKKTKQIRTDSEKAFEKAVTAYKKLIDKNPEDDAAYFNLGRSYNKLNEDEEAEKALKQAVKLTPDSTQYQTELGSILIKLAKYSEAVAALRKAVDLDSDNLEAQDLLERAEAGKKRVDYAPVKTDEKPSNKATPAANTDEETPANANKPATPEKKEKPSPPPANKPQ